MPAKTTFNKTAALSTIAARLNKTSKPIF